LFVFLSVKGSDQELREANIQNYLSDFCLVTRLWDRSSFEKYALDVGNNVPFFANGIQQRKRTVPIGIKHHLY
jgi:hypothetical protein